MEVIVLAGGLGTRLRSAIGTEIPKCMAPVAGKPFLWYLLKDLERQCVTRVILSVGHLREVIYRWIDECGAEFPFQIDYAVEETPLGTGGGIRLALTKCTEDVVLVLNGDTYFKTNLSALAEDCRAHSSLISLALKPMQRFERYGSVDTDSCGVVTRFNEKQFCERGEINGGVYAIDRMKLLQIALPEKFSFEKEVLEVQCALGALRGIREDGYFIDIGIPEDYAKANSDFKSFESL